MLKNVMTYQRIHILTKLLYVTYTKDTRLTSSSSDAASGMVVGNEGRSISGPWAGLCTSFPKRSTVREAAGV